MRTIIAQALLISPETPIRPDASETRSMAGRENQQLPEPKTPYVRPPPLHAKARRLTRLNAQIVRFAYSPPSFTPLTGRGSRTSELAIARINAARPACSVIYRRRCLNRCVPPYFSASSALPSVDNGEPARPVLLTNACPCSHTREQLLVYRRMNLSLMETSNATTLAPLLRERNDQNTVFRPLHACEIKGDADFI
jgi:hypothetical protein